MMPRPLRYLQEIFRPGGINLEAFARVGSKGSVKRKLARFIKKGEAGRGRRSGSMLGVSCAREIRLLDGRASAGELCPQ